MIELRGAGKTYPNGKGVFDVSMRLEYGLTGFLGRNGSGKTTTMRLIMGLLAPDRGTVLIDGRDLWQYDHIYTLKRDLGFLPNDDYFFPRLTGRENLEYLSLLKTGERDAYAALDRFITELEVDAFIDDPFDTYSTGMKKKVQLVGALIGDPGNMLLDEPHNGLDVMANIALNRTLLRLRDEGRTIFVASHLAEVFDTIADALVVIDQGRIVAAAPRAVSEEAGGPVPGRDRCFKRGFAAGLAGPDRPLPLQRLTQHARRAHQENVSEAELALRVLQGPAGLDRDDRGVVRQRLARQTIPNRLHAPPCGPALLVSPLFEGGCPCRADRVVRAVRCHDDSAFMRGVQDVAFGEDAARYADRVDQAAVRFGRPVGFGRPARGQPLQRVGKSGLGVIGGEAPERAPGLEQVRARVTGVDEHPAPSFPDRGGQGRAAPAPERLQHVPLRTGQGVREHVAGPVVLA